MYTLNLHPSRQAIVLVFGSHLFALLAIHLSVLDNRGQFALFLSVAVLACCWLQRARRESNRKPLLMRLQANACCLEQDGRQWRFRPPGIKYLGQWLIILSLEPESGCSADRGGFRRRIAGGRKLVLLRDSLSRQDDWRLRVWLKQQQEQHFA